MKYQILDKTIPTLTNTQTNEKNLFVNGRGITENVGLRISEINLWRPCVSFTTNYHSSMEHYQEGLRFQNQLRSVWGLGIFEALRLRLLIIFEIKEDDDGCL